MPLFELTPEVASPWLPLCSRNAKRAEAELASYFPFLRIDSKGNLSLKFRLLHEVVLAKVYLVLSEFRVLLINSSSEVAMMGLLEMLGGDGNAS